MGHKTPEYQPGAASITLRRYTHRACACVCGQKRAILKTGTPSQPGGG
jgi:hypothetical protein